MLRPFADGRAAAYGLVLFLDLRSTASGDQRPEIVLKATEGNEIAICLHEVYLYLAKNTY